MFTHVDQQKQERFMDILMKHLQANRNKIYLTTSEHPFTDFYSTDESRITTHYYKENVMSAIFSTIHEFGHAKLRLTCRSCLQWYNLKEQHWLCYA